MDEILSVYGGERPRPPLPALLMAAVRQQACSAFAPSALPSLCSIFLFPPVSLDRVMKCTTHTDTHKPVRILKRTTLSGRSPHLSVPPES